MDWVIIKYKNSNKFYNIFEPSGATTLPDGKVLIVEDERSENPIRMLDIKDDGNVVEIDGTKNNPRIN